jgi:hypothetical protein
MNAWLAGFFVTSAWLSMAYVAIRRQETWQQSKIGLLLYAMGTFLWSLKGIEIHDTGLILISAIQTLAVLIGVILL